MENRMTNRPGLKIVVLAALLSTFTLGIHAADVQQDAKAIEVLEQMVAYKSTLDQVVITGVTSMDARLDAGLMVSNSEEISVSISRPGSMRITNFDGEATKGLYFHNGMLSFFNSANMLYAQADIPEEIDAAMEFAMEELEIEAPLMDLIYKDAGSRLITSEVTILYLVDKARVGGTDCHHLAIRGPEVDIQLWIEEGDRPLPRQFMFTSKWEGGSPRFIANLSWETDPNFEPGFFEFKAPEGATKIRFITQQ
jgi:hypothetical protein